MGWSRLSSDGRRRHLRDARRFYYEGDLNPFPDYTAEGSFSERQYTFKSGGGDSVGRAFRGVEAFKDVDTKLNGA